MVRQRHAATAAVRIGAAAMKRLLNFLIGLVMRLVTWLAYGKKD
jgi:hypothetical protein